MRVYGMDPLKHPPVHSLPCILAVVLYIAHLTAATFICPNEIQCECDATDPSNIVINCRNKNLWQLPQFEPSQQNFYELTLAKNFISIIPENAFVGIKIKRLDISENPLARIAEQAFTGLGMTLEELHLEADPSSDVLFPTIPIKNLTKLKYLEIKGFNVPQIPTGALNPHTQLQKLVMHKCNLDDLDSSTFEGPKNTLEYIDFKENGFSNIPKAALAKLTTPFEILLSQNQIVVLDATSFAGITKLAHLDLSQSALRLGTQSFIGLENSLISLNVHSCQLASTDMVAFKILRNLQVLNLNFNPIETITDDIFDNMNSLRELQMHDNQVSSLTASTFGGVEDSLRILNLAQNQLRSVASNTFSGLSQLQELYLDRMPAGSWLAGTMFDSLAGSLQLLSMEGAQLTASHWPVLNKLVNLETLRLSSNNMQTIPDMMFVDYSKLKDLQLALNGISAVSQRSVHGLEGSLEALDLHDNNIDTISVCALDPDKFTKLDIFQLRLTENPLKCDCHLLWLYQWLKEHSNDFLFEFVDWTCEDGQLFRNLAEVDFVCDPPAEDPVCENLTPSTSTQAPTTPLQEPLYVAINGSTATTIFVTWDIRLRQALLYFKVAWFIPNSSEEKGEKIVGKDARSTLIENLEPLTTYQICINMEYIGEEPSVRTCVEARTTDQPGDSGAGTAELQIILGCVFGALALIILIIILVVCCIRRSKKEDKPFDGGEIGKLGNMPQAGYNSKRFSRQRPRDWEVQQAMQNIKNKDHELQDKLDGFRPEERDRILALLRQTGGSTLSVISNASSQRYVPDPPPMRPRGADGYMNPVDLNDEQPYQNANGKHEYEEIPADTYDQIPADDYI